MSINIIQGNVLDAKADAIILSIDGSARGMEGNLCRQFASRWPDVWQEVQDDIRCPIPLGKVFDHEPVTNCAFRLILLVSTLHHREVLDDRAKMGVIRTAMENAIKLTVQYDVETMATAIMSGGWRLSQERAFLAMAEGYDSASRIKADINLNIYVLDIVHHKKISSLAKSIGW